MDIKLIQNLLRMGYTQGYIAGYNGGITDSVNTLTGKKITKFLPIGNLADKFVKERVEMIDMKEVVKEIEDGKQE